MIGQRVKIFDMNETLLGGSESYKLYRKRTKEFEFVWY